MQDTIEDTNWPVRLVSELREDRVIADVGARYRCRAPELQLNPDIVAEIEFYIVHRY